MNLECPEPVLTSGMQGTKHYPSLVQTRSASCARMLEAADGGCWTDSFDVVGDGREGGCERWGSSKREVSSRPDSRLQIKWRSKDKKESLCDCLSGLPRDSSATNVAVLPNGEVAEVLDTHVVQGLDETRLIDSF